MKFWYTSVDNYIVLQQAYSNFSRKPVKTVLEGVWSWYVYQQLYCGIVTLLSRC